MTTPTTQEQLEAYLTNQFGSRWYNHPRSAHCAFDFLCSRLDAQAQQIEALKAQRLPPAREITFDIPVVLPATAALDATQGTPRNYWR